LKETALLKRVRLAVLANSYIEDHSMSMELRRCINGTRRIPCLRTETRKTKPMKINMLTKPRQGSPAAPHLGMTCQRPSAA
jgi:hypothetical protein